METCISEDVCYLLTIEADSMQDLKEYLLISGYRTDYMIFLGMLKHSFKLNQLWIHLPITMETYK